MLVNLEPSRWWQVVQNWFSFSFFRVYREKRWEPESLRRVYCQLILRPRPPHSSSLPLSFLFSFLAPPPVFQSASLFFLFVPDLCFVSRSWHSGIFTRSLARWKERQRVYTPCASLSFSPLWPSTRQLFFLSLDFFPSLSLSFPSRGETADYPSTRDFFITLTLD